MHRREYKRKTNEAAIEEASEIISDLDTWESSYPDLLAKIDSPRAELRLSAMRSINKILSGKYIGMDIEPYIDQTVLVLRQPLFEPVSQQEHDEAFGVLCNLATNIFNEFEPTAILILNQVSPLLPGLNDEEAFTYFAIAYIVSLSVSSESECRKILNQFLNLAFSKKARTSEISPESEAELIKAIGIMIAAFPEHIAGEDVRPNLCDIIDKAFTTQKTPVILAALELIPIIYESIVMLEETEAENTEEIVNTQQSRQFASKYRSKISSLTDNVTKKQDQKDIKASVKSIVDYLDGEEMMERIVLNIQTVDITGPRRIYLMSAIRRVTKAHFQIGMSQNAEIHNLLGFEIMGHHDALRVKKKNKKKIEAERMTNTKDRKRDLAKKRNQKEERLKADF